MPDTFIDLRDRFFALSSPTADESSKEAFRQRVADVETEATLEIDGLSMSFHPSRRFKAVRFIDAERLDKSVRDSFTRPSAAMPHLAAVFVDPEEFSYRTFENIVPLDRHLPELALSMTKLAKLGRSRDAKAFSYTLEAEDDSKQALAGLDGLDLYVEPLNTASRGGRRFIFCSEKLSTALSGAVREALPAPWLKGFSHVNPVFRCNRFEPDDAPFKPHIDTPYYDASRHHISRYTLLIYLTGGDADSLLRVEDELSLEHVDAFTCVVFPQDMEHEGAPFDAGRKVFLRTELIYEDAKVEHQPDIARMFAKACYLTGESVFAPELARYSHELYDRTAKAHWRGVESAAEIEPLLHKKFRGIELVTNGYDFWFSSDQLAPAEAAAIAVLDVMNGKVFGQAFRKQCQTEVIERDEAPTEWVPALLSRTRSPKQSPFAKLPEAQLFPPTEEVDSEMCCPFHCYETWDATRNVETVDYYERAQELTRRYLAQAPIKMMGQELFLDPDSFVVEAGRIHVLSDKQLEPVNFAACWNDESTAPNYVQVDASIEAPFLLVPPILYREANGVIHLMLDLFRNSWMVSAKERTIPVPRLITDYPDDHTSPWLEAAHRGIHGELPEDAEDDPWWLAEESDLALELDKL